MNEFIKRISSNGDQTMQRRSATLSTTAELAQSNLLNQLKAKKAQLELEIDKLTDLAPETTDSLRPGTKDWDATQWVIAIQNAKVELYQVNIAIKLAEETYKEFFTEIDG